MSRRKTVKQVKEEPLEKQFWKVVDKLRKNIDAAEYKHVVLGLIFLKYISDAFEEIYARLQAGEGEMAGADPKDKDEYKAENAFFVPVESRWSCLVAQTKQPDIGMETIEKENPCVSHGYVSKGFCFQGGDILAL